MMNVIALWILFSTLGAANVMYPDQSLLKTSPGEQQPLEGAKAAAAESLRSFLETSRQTGEGIREKVSAAADIPRRTADAVQHFGVEVAQVVKDGSQSGLEKIGLARPEERHGTDAVQHFVVDVAQVVKDGSQSGLEKIGLARPEERDSTEGKSYNEIIKEEALDAYRGTKDAAGDTVEATGDKVRQAGSAAKAKLSNTVGFVQEEVSEKAGLVGDSASGIAQSLQGTFNAAEGKASEITGSAHERATDLFKGTAEETDHVEVDPSISSYKDKVKRASGQAAEIVKNRATQAASVLPNVGQGLAYGTKDAHWKGSAADFTDNTDRVASEGKQESRPGFLDKVIEYLKGVKHAAGNYYECAKGKLSGSVVQCGQWKEQIVNKASNSMNEAGEVAGRAKDRAVNVARNSAGIIIDGIHGTKHDLEDRSVEESRKFLDTSDNLTQTTADAAHTLKSRTLSRFQKLKWIASAYLLSSCRTAHLFVFSSVYGSSLWVTFVSGYLLSHSIPRQQFGIVQSRIFPAYFRLAGVGQAVCLLLFLILHPWSKADGDEKLQQLDLLATLGLTLANIFFLEPRATKAMFQKLKMEKEEGRGQDGLSDSEDDETKVGMAKVDNKFRTYHGYSSLANFLSLIGMTCHLWHLSRRLVVQT